MPLRLFQVPTSLVFGNIAKLSMILAQPHVELAGVPFQLTPLARARQTTLLRELIEFVTKTDAAEQPAIILFPEYSFPLEFVQEFETALASTKWRNNSIVISGLEGADAAATR